VLLLAHTGPRWGEATGLQVRDLGLLRNRATVSENAVQVGAKVFMGATKGSKQRTVPLPEFLLPCLARQCEDKGRDEPLFPGNDCRHLHRPDTGSRWFDKAVIKYGVAPTTPHDLRHTAASLAKQRVGNRPEAEEDSRGGPQDRAGP
jgi:integrase